MWRRLASKHFPSSQMRNGHRKLIRVCHLTAGAVLPFKIGTASVSLGLDRATGDRSHNPKPCCRGAYSLVWFWLVLFGGLVFFHFSNSHLLLCIFQIIASLGIHF